MERKQYRLMDGRVLFVGRGLGEKTFMTFVHRAGGIAYWYISRMLPVCTTIDEAQADLDAYAKKKKLELAGLVSLKSFDPKPVA